MHCQIHGSSSASCRCHECQSLLCSDCWPDHCLDVHGHYPAELDIPYEQEEDTRMMTPGPSTTRDSGSVSLPSDRKGGSSVAQSRKSRCARPSPKATERTTTTSSHVVFTPASSRHSDSDLRYTGREQYSRVANNSRDGASSRTRSEHDINSILAEYLKDSKQPWSPYNLRSDKKDQDSSGGETRR